MSNAVVPGVPHAALQAIKDENVKAVLQALVDGWQVRNNQTGSGDNKFLTQADFDAAVASMIKDGKLFPGFGGTGSTGVGGQMEQGSVGRMLNWLTSRIQESALWVSLGAEIARISIANSGNQAEISSEIEKRINSDNAIVVRTDTQVAVINQHISAVEQITSTLSNSYASLAQQTTTLQASVGSFTSLLQTEATTRANADGELYAQYSVKIDQNGYVSGFGLSSTANNSTPLSEFYIRADRFAIGSPTVPHVVGETPPTVNIPFIVQTTNWTDANGVVQPPGVFIKGAFIESASIDSADIRYAAIQNAHIGDLQVSTLKIAGNAVTVPMTVNMPAQVSGTGVGVPLISGSIYLPQAGVVYAIFTGSQGYGSGLRDSITQLFIDGNLMMSVGGAAVTVNVAVSGSMAVSAGLHTVAVRWVGQDSGVHMDNGTLFIQGAMR